ncbi:hypothetical protein [Lentzea sp. NPDC059081]|uniref:hypothetical protein n=1 Tax=Lentzea sp. NPDC059081 TaxID=3346719 RepID=UPI0036A870A0
MNATAVRLPDQFSPGAAATSAATPTCCCCCCCCAVSSVGAAVQIPAALHRDTKDLPGPRGALVLPSAIFPLLVLVSPFVTHGAVFDLHWGWWAGAVGAVLGWAVAAGFLARSPKPWTSAVRLLGWASLFCVEPFVAVPLLGGISQLGDVAAASGFVLYLGGALTLGIWIFRRNRAKS